MNCNFRCGRYFLLVIAAGSAAAVLPATARAQVVGGVAGQLGQLGQQGQQGQLGQLGQQGQQGLLGNLGAGGIVIDAEGVVRAVFVPDRNAKLARQRLASSAEQHLSADVRTASPLRKVSLVRLEQALRAYADSQQSAPLDMVCLAGLQRIDYVFLYPETNDLVIAGPAAGFGIDAVGRPVAVDNGRPPLRLDDLLAAMRALERAGTIGCSIDPRPENLAKVNQFLASNSSAATASIVRQRYVQVTQLLGMQDVKVWGVPADSHYAQVLVEADYRMKLIGLGLEKTPVKTLKSHLQMVGTSGNSMQRWWFTPLYDAFVRSDDGLAYQFAGQRLQLSSQEEVVSTAGVRTDAPTTRTSTQKYAQHFTEKFPELADSVPVFAELQSAVDLAVLAALIKKDKLAEKVGWKRELFLDTVRLPIAKGNVPRQVASVHNTKQAGSTVIALVSGGVEIDPIRTASLLEFKRDEGAAARTRAASANADVPAEHPWWWD